MAMKVISTDTAPSAIGPYSQAMDTGGMLFVSGQLGMAPKTGEFVGEDISAQTRQALENLKSIVTAAGLSLNDVSAVDAFLTDMGDFAAFNAVYQEFFSDHKPARAVVAVKELPKGGIVEIKCMAVRNT
jgi:2-iminobutanoate/2-iminopropanoate deaminase